MKNENLDHDLNFFSWSPSMLFLLLFQTNQMTLNMVALLCEESLDPPKTLEICSEVGYFHRKNLTKFLKIWLVGLLKRVSSSLGLISALRCFPKDIVFVQQPWYINLWERDCINYKCWYFHGLSVTCRLGPGGKGNLVFTNKLYVSSYFESEYACSACLLYFETIW